MEKTVQYLETHSQNPYYNLAFEEYVLCHRTQGDYLLLCSDGLSNVVTDQEILYEVIHGGEDEACCQRLLDVALHRGAPDNGTVVLMRC